MLKTPDPNVAASSSVSTCQSAPRIPAGSDIVSDTPAGFLHDDPPGLTKAHCLHTGETTEPYIDSSRSLDLGIRPGLSLVVPPGFTKAHRLLHTGETTDPYIDTSHSLPLDTPPGFPLDIPPGFTEAHRLPIVTTAGSENVVSEKKPLIKFTLNVPRVAQTEALPGSTKLLAVKQEPGLPAVYKSIETIASTGQADEIKSKHDEVVTELDESSEERLFSKTRLLSDILSSLASSNANKNTSPKPTNIHLNRTVICRLSVGKFQEAPEKQTQGKKRDHPESPEPSAADTFKRLKVNGHQAHRSKQNHGSSNIEFPTKLKGRISRCTSVRSYSTDPRSKGCMCCMLRRVPNAVICGTIIFRKETAPFGLAALV